MTQTANYGLSQWDPEDRILRTDFNSDNAKIDAALAEHQSVIETFGNCRIETFSYTGTGTYGSSNPTKITFSKPPLLFFVRGSDALVVGSKLFTGTTSIVYDSTLHGAGIGEFTLTWNGNQASLAADRALFQVNTSGKTYYVFALFAEDE